MCEECITPKASVRLCGCCLATRRFMTPEERIDVLDEYREQLQKEIAGVEKTLEEIKREIK